jgi:hypothetical protein
MVQNARLVYSFGSKESVRSRDFNADLKTFDKSKKATVEDGLRQAGVDINKIKAGKFACSSLSNVPSCLARLKATGILGTIVDQVYSQDNILLTNVAGRIEYEWRSSDNRTNARSSPFTIIIPILKFDIGQEAECGAPGPVDRRYAPVILSLDRTNYRIPLSWRGPLAVRAEKRFGLTLTAPKSSHHVFKAVFELADGTTLTSPTVDLSYFTPRLPQGGN